LRACATSANHNQQYKKAYDMSTTVNRKKSLLAALGAASAALLALSAPLAQAAPDGQDTNNPANISPGPTSQLQTLQLHASENPVICGVMQDWKAVAVTWTPAVWASFTITDNGQPVEEGWGWNKSLAVVCGHTFTIQVTYKLGDTWETTPPLTITSSQAPTSTPMPQLPRITPTLIPRLPDRTN
jgi:hypothetical protein